MIDKILKLYFMGFSYWEALYLVKGDVISDKKH